MATKQNPEPIHFQEPMSLDKMIGLLLGLRSQLPGDTIVHVVFPQSEIANLTMDVGAMRVEHYGKAIPSAIRLIGQHF